MNFTHILQRGITGIMGASLAGAALLVAALAAQGAPMDADGDGLVTLEELQASIPEATEELFMTMDIDDSGALDLAEVTRGIDMGLLPEDA
ncbi:EF-hand domain-containing protein [Nioella aestuarii]|uniref:EF-hand domain-containing protein n=1 Tax=Nioella aestuarii TaxID=1662864 RepID=UPI003D7FCE44